MLFDKKETIYKKKDRETWQQIKDVLKAGGIRGVSASHYAQDVVRAGGCGAKLDPRDFGAKGNNVKWLQWHLNQLGEKLTVDGNFGIYTKIALLKFQKSSKLVPDGVVGAKTRAALKKAVK